MSSYDQARRGRAFRAMAGVCVALLCLAGTSAGPAAQASPTPFNVAFTSTMFAAVNTNDARAAVMVLAREIAAARNIPITPVATVYERIEDLRSAVDAGKVQFAMLSVPQYYELQRPDFAKTVLISRRGRVKEEFLLLAKKGSVARLSDLEGSTVMTADGLDHDMSLAWLATVLADRRLPPPERFFRSVTSAPKVPRAVLAVYFGQASACIVTRSALETIIELNPQVGASLEPLATSPPLVSSVALLAHGSDYTLPRFLDALSNLHENARGQQGMRLFGIERMTIGAPTDLASSIDMVRALGRHGQAGR